MFASNQVLDSAASVKDELKRDNRPVVDLGELVRHIKVDLELIGVDLEAVDKIGLEELQNMISNELRAKVMFLT
ncbi:hypothetical protein [Bacillus infantis]|uniref:hypothetical protein n=1 Tax=Bacillus infantis TaxID=324767 RepID=UPI003CE90CFF